MEFLLPMVLVAVILTVLYIVYESGQVSVDFKRSLLYAGYLRPAAGKGKASFKRCTGYDKGVLRFKEMGQKEFVFTSDVTKGRMWIEIQNKDKEVVLRLEGENDRKVLTADAGDKFFVLARFEKAEGKYEINWK